MASVIEIVIKAKNEAGQKLKQVEREANAMAHNLRKNTEFMRGAFAAIGAGVVAFATAIVAGVAKTVGAYMESERAVSNLREAHRVWGDEVEKNIQRETEFASALMKQTNVDNESITNSMAQLRMLGMRTEALEDGAKAVIAMTRAGAGEEGAAQLVAMAYQGNYDRLQRYIPALKNATTETEKAAIVNDFLAKQLSIQKAETNTLGGQWAALKIQVGETFESMGKNLNDSGVIQSGLRTVKQLVSNIGEAFEGWSAGGGIEEVAGMFRNIGSFLSFGAIASTTEKAKELQQMSKSEWEKSAGLSGTPAAAKVEPLAVAGTDPEIALRAQRIATARAVAVEQLKAEQARYEAERSSIEKRISYEEGAQAELSNLRVKQELDAAKALHAQNMKAISDEADAAFEANKTGQEESIKAGKAEIDAAQKAADVRSKSHEDEMVLVGKLQADKRKVDEEISQAATDAAKQAVIDADKKKLDIQEAAAKEKIAAADKLSDERKTLSEGPRAFKARIKEEQAAERKKKDDELRFQRLKALEGKRGLKLSKEDLAFMEDFKTIKDAERAKEDLKTIEENRLRLQQDATNAMDSLLLEQQNINAVLTQLLVAR